MGTSYNPQGWSATPASNESADSGIGTVNGQASPGVVDDWVRGLMASVKKFSLDISGSLVSGGTPNALILTTNQNISTSHQATFSVRFKAGNTNTGPATVAVDSLSPVVIKRLNGDDLSAGDIVSGGIYDIAHDGTNYKLLGAGPGSGTYGVLSGDNTWGGANTFSSTVSMTGAVTVGDGSGDTVVIKGTTVNSFMSGLLANSTAANLRSAIGLGTAATQNTGTSGGNVPLLNGTNTWSAGQSLETSTGSVTPLRIDRSGAADSGVGLIRLNKGGASDIDMIRFLAGGSLAGKIMTGSDSTTYVTSSDGRLKPDEDREPIADAGSVIDALDPIRFKWRGGGVDYGFIAQDVHAVLPEVVVVGSPEGVSPDDEGFTPWMLERGRFEPFLIAEVQNLRKRVAALEGA